MIASNDFECDFEGEVTLAICHLTCGFLGATSSITRPYTLFARDEDEHLSLKRGKCFISSMSNFLHHLQNPQLGLSSVIQITITTYDLKNARVVLSILVCASWVGDLILSAPDMTRMVSCCIYLRFLELWIGGFLLLLSFEAR